MDNDRQVIVSVRADISDLQRGLQQVQTALTNTSTSIGRMRGAGNGILQMFGAIFAFQGINALTQNVGEAVNNFGKLENTVQKFGSVWANEAQSMMNWSQQFADSTGMAQSQVLQTANNFGDLMLGLGISEKATSQMSQSLTQLAYDLAAANAGTVTQEDAIRNLQSAMLGEAQAGKTLGINMLETQMQQTAYNMGIKGTWTSLNETTKMLVRYQAILEQSATSHGFAANAVETVIGTQQRLKTSLTETSQYLGLALAPAYKTLADIMINVVVPVVKSVTSMFVTFFKSVADGGWGLYVLVGILSLVAGMIAYGVGVIIISIKAKLTEIGANLALAASNGVLASAIASVIVVAILLLTIFKKVKNVLKGKIKPPEFFTSKDIAKNMKDIGKTVKKGNKKQKKYANEQEEIEDKLNKELKKQFKERMKAYANMGSFLQGVQRKILGASNIIKAAKSSVTAMKDFNNAIDTLKKRLGNNPMADSFLTELRQLDPDQYADYVKALASATDEELQNIVSLWGERHKEAVKRAGDEIEAAKPEIQQQIVDSVTVDKDTLDDLGGAIGDGISNGLSGALSGMGGEIGKSLLDGLGDGVSKTIGDVAFGAIIGGIIGAIIGGLAGPGGVAAGAKIGSAIGALLGDSMKQGFEDWKKDSATYWEQWGEDFKTNVAKGGFEGGVGVVHSIFEGMKTAMKSAREMLWKVVGEPIVNALLDMLGVDADTKEKIKGVVKFIQSTILMEFGNLDFSALKPLIAEKLQLALDNLKTTSFYAKGKEMMQQLAQGIADNGTLKGTIITISGWIVDWFKGTTLYQTGKNITYSLAQGIADFDIHATINRIKANIISWFQGTSLYQVGVSIAQGFGQGLEHAKTAISNIILNMKKALNSLIDGINSKMQFTIPWYIPVYGGKSWGLNIPHIPLYANGGIVDKATLGVFGEAGAEALIPLQGANKMKPFAQAIAGFMGGSGSGGNINVYGMTVREEADITRISQELYNLQRQDQRRLGY